MAVCEMRLLPFGQAWLVTNRPMPQGGIIVAPLSERRL